MLTAPILPLKLRPGETGGGLQNKFEGETTVIVQPNFGMAQRETHHICTLGTSTTS